MAFTDWNTLYGQLKDDLASGSWKRKSYRLSDREVTYRDIDEFLEFFRFVEERAKKETTTYSTRVYAATRSLGS